MCIEGGQYAWDLNYMGGEASYTLEHAPNWTHYHLTEQSQAQ
jgi:hypothetical protein